MTTSADTMIGGPENSGPENSGPENGGKRFTGRKMLICVLAFFGVVILANGVMMTFALRTHSGVVVPNSYVASQDFNKTIAAANVQNALGWRATVTYGAGAVRLRVVDRRGAPVHGLDIAAVVGRTVTDAEDRSLAFRPEAPGAYGAVAPLARGVWRLDMLAMAGDGVEYRRNFTFVVPAE